MRALLISLGATSWYDAKDMHPDADLFQRAASAPAYTPRMNPRAVAAEHPEVVR